MAKHRTYSIEFKRQVVQEFLGGETLHALAKRHDVYRKLIRIWVQKYETGAFDEEAAAADLLQQYAARIVALERLVGRQALELEFLKGLDKAHRDREAGLCPSLPAPGAQYRRRMSADGDHALGFYAAPPAPKDDTAIVEAIAGVCDEFEFYGWRRVQAALSPAGRDRQPQEDQAPHARAWPAAENQPAPCRNNR